MLPLSECMEAELLETRDSSHIYYMSLDYDLMVIIHQIHYYFVRLLSAWMGLMIRVAITPKVIYHSDLKCQTESLPPSLKTLQFQGWMRHDPKVMIWSLANLFIFLAGTMNTILNGISPRSQLMVFSPRS